MIRKRSLRKKRQATLIYSSSNATQMVQPSNSLFSEDKSAMGNLHEVTPASLGHSEWLPCFKKKNNESRFVLQVVSS